MRELKNHPSPDQLDSYDKYPCYYENDLELVYTCLLYTSDAADEL